MSADPSERSRDQPAPKPGASFPRSARLLKHSDFDLVYRQGRRHFSPHMTVFYLPQAVSTPGRAPGTKPEGTPGSASPGIASESASAERNGKDVQSAPAARGPRIGFTVGRVLGGAVERNRIKRRLREAVRLRRGLLNAGAVDVVINPKKSVLTLEFSAVLEEIGRAFDAIARRLPSASNEKRNELPTGKNREAANETRINERRNE